MSTYNSDIYRGRYIYETDDIIKFSSTSFFKEIRRKIEEVQRNFDKIINSTNNPVEKHRYKKYSTFLSELHYVMFIKCEKISVYKRIGDKNFKVDNEYIGSLESLKKNISSLLKNPVVKNKTVSANFNMAYGLKNNELKLADAKNHPNEDFTTLLLSCYKIVDELLIYAKKQKKESEKKQVTDSGNSEMTSNQGSTFSSSYSNDYGELASITNSMVIIYNKEMTRLFSKLSANNLSKDEQQNVTEEILNYVQTFKKIENYYKKLSYDEKKREIKTLENRISKVMLEKIFGSASLTPENLSIENLSLENMINLINIGVKQKMELKGYNYYSLGNKMTNNYIEICQVTEYMGIEQVCQIYSSIKKSIPNYGYRRSHEESLQQNFAFAIYKLLINRGYIIEKDDLTDSTMYEICTELLKDNDCYFMDCSKKKTINLIEIINSKNFNATKLIYEENSPYGRLRKRIGGIRGRKL